MMDCPNFAKMQKLFQRKNASTSKGQMVVEVKTIIVDVNVVDINVATRSIITKDHVFQEREPWKNKNIKNQEKEDKFQKTMVETVQQL